MFTFSATEGFRAAFLYDQRQLALGTIVAESAGTRDVTDPELIALLVAVIRGHLSRRRRRADPRQARAETWRRGAARSRESWNLSLCLAMWDATCR